MSTQPGARIATPELVRQLVEEVRDQIGDRAHPEPLVIGARAQPHWTHGPVATPHGPIEVAACATPLAARSAMAQFAAARSDPGADHVALVVLTDLPDADLGADVLGRFVRPRLLSLSAWNAVRQRFGVRHLDPAFGDARYSWMADALLDVPLDSVTRGGGVLSVEAGLQAVTEAVLGATAVTPERLLIASARTGFAARVDHADARTIEHLCATIASTLGPAGELIAGTISNGRGERALPAGLAARTLTGAIDGSFAQAKVDDLTGVENPTDAALAAWARAAELAFAELVAADNPIAIDVALAGSALVTEWKAPQADASDVLSASFEKRLDLLAAELERTLDDTAAPDTSALRLAVHRVVTHRDADTDIGRPRAQRAQLAARLASWLRDPASAHHGTGVIDSTTPQSLTAAIDAYLSDGAWVDTARRRVGEGDDTPERFAHVLRRISSIAHARRADGNRAFAETLARWTIDGTAAELANSTVTAVESVLADIVAPIASLQPVLLVVLDGCGLAQFLELAGQFRNIGLREVGRSGQRHCALAALPTVTEVSRTTLLTGKLRTGGAADEKRHLPTNPAISKLDGLPARVFHHRPDLVTGNGQGLPGPVIEAISVNGPRVIAAVVNTIDDELSRGTFNPEYRIEQLGPLLPLLRAAVDAGRAVVVTADHGHVLGVGLDGKGDVNRSGDGGDRWRQADRPPTEDEVLLSGPRVLLGDDRGILAPWHDDLRYSAKHGGYHGGATPDECIVPLSVFIPVGTPDPAGWTPVAVVPPTWWDLHVDIAAEPTNTKSTKRKRRAEPRTGELQLFPDPTPEPENTPTEPTKIGTAPPPPTAASAPWLDQLISSDTYTVQLGAIARSKPPEDRVRATLGALHARGGVASFGVIAQATGMPLARVQGFMAIIARVLNVDGFGVLTVDVPGQEARLDEALLIAQFLAGAAQ